MADGAPGSGEVAGRLEVVVESDLRGFKDKLKTKIEAAAADIKAKIGVELDPEQLRDELETKVKAAAEGVKAKIGVELDIDPAKIKASVEAAAKAAGAKVSVEVDVDGVTAEVAEAQAAVDRKPLLARIKTRGGLIAEALREKFLAQRAVDASGAIEVPIEPKVPKGRGLGRGFLRGGVMVGLLSMVQPVVGAIGQAIGGLTAMVGAAAPATGLFAALPVGMSAMVQGMLGITVAAGGTGEAMKALAEKEKVLADGGEWTAEQQDKLREALDKLSPSAQKFVRRLVGLRDEWAAIKKDVQEPLFKPLADNIEGVADKLLPRLRRGLVQTSEAVGSTLGRALEWMQGDRFGKNLSGIMRQNSGTIEAGGDAIRLLLDGMMEFQRAAGPFQRDLNRWVRSRARLFRDTMRENRDNGDTEDFLKKAQERAGILWEITKDIGAGIRGVFAAGDASGMRLLDSFGDWADQWRKWVEGDGQARIQAWFASTEGGFRELGLLVRDTFNGLLKWAEDPAIVDMIHQIRTELGPALGDFFQNLGKNIGPDVIDFLTSAVELVNELAPATEALGDVLAGIAKVVRTAARIIEGTGGAGDVALAAAGYYTAFKLLRRILTGSAALRAAGGRGGLMGMLFGGGAVGAKGAKGAAAAGAAASGAAGTVAAIGNAADTSTRKVGRLGGAINKLSRGRFGAPRGTAVSGGRFGGAAGGAGLLAMLLGPAVAHDIFDGGGADAARAAFTDIGIAIDQGRVKTQQKLQTIHTALQASDFGQYAQDFGFDLAKVTQGIFDQARGKVDTEAAHYVDAVRNALEPLADAANGPMSHFKHDLSFVYGGDKELNADRMLGGLDAVVSEFDKVASKGKEAAASAKQARQQIDNFFKGTPTAGLSSAGVSPRGKRGGVGADGGIGSLLTGPLRNVKTGKIPAPKVDTGGIRKEGQKARGMFAQIFKAVKLPPIKPPKMNSKPLRSDVKQTGNFITRAFRALNLKPIKPPKLNQKPIRGDVKQTGDFITRTFRALKIKPIKAPKINGRPAKQSAQETGRSVAKSLTKGGQDASKGMQRGMTGVVKAIRSKQGPARGASQGVANASKAPFTGLANQFNVLGSNAMQGLINGINARRGEAVAAARAVAAAVAQASRAQLQVRSPSRVMMRIGEYVSEGFAVGITKGASRVAKARKKLMGMLTDAGWSKAERAAFKRDTRRQFAGLEKDARRKEALAKRNERAEGRLRELKKRAAAAKETTQGFRDSQRQYGSLSTLFELGGGYLTPGFAISELRRRAGESKEFRANIDKLRKRGLGRGALKSLVEAGVEQGGQIASSLMDATRAQLRQISRLQAQLSGRYADGIGKDVGEKFTRAGINAAKGMVKGLRSKQGALNKAAKHMANSLVKQVKKSLRIKSPSGVMADLGGYTVDGMAVGINGRANRLMRDARRISDDLARNLSTHAATNLHSSARRANGRASLRPLARGADGRAALVGQLVINGKDRGEIRDALDEALFTLRKIRTGGLHADRTS